MYDVTETTPLTERASEINFSTFARESTTPMSTT
jgi:hypothetical protein